jgi:hypothetical protein
MDFTKGGQAEVFRGARWRSSVTVSESPRAVTHPPKNADDRQSPEAPEPEVQYVSAKDVVEATGLSTSASEAICATKPVGRFESALFSPENP